MARRPVSPITWFFAGGLLTGLATPLPADDAVVLRDPRASEGRAALVLRDDLGSWEGVAARVVAHGPGGLRSIPPSSPGTLLAVDLEAGCTLLAVDLGPASASTKIAVCGDAASPAAALADRLAAAATMTAKTGSRIEIRPLRSPTLAAPGTDLPLRVYFDDAPRPGARVVAVEPSGGRQVRTADSAGITWVEVRESGPWVVRFRLEAGGAASTAELRFDVPPEVFWDALPPFLPAAKRQAAEAETRPAPEKRRRFRSVEWRELGPAPLLSGTARNTGRASSIVASTTRANRYYVGGATGGVWESVDGGASWTPLNDELPFLAIGALAVDPGNDKVIYAGSGEANYAYHSLYGQGLYRTFNRGRTWRVLGPNLFEGRTFSRLVVSPHDRREIWAAVARAGGSFEGFEGAREHPKADGRTGVFRSRDRGATWDHLRASNGLFNFPASDVDLDPVDARRVFVAMGDVFGRNRNGVYRSTDGGGTFEPLLTQESEGVPFGRVTVALAPSDPDRVYAMVTHPTATETTGGFSPPGASAGALYRSIDGGATWSRSETGNFMGQQGDYNSAVIVDPDDPDTVFLGGVRMLRSTDGGLSFADVTPVHVDQHDMTFDAAGRLLVANDGGVNRSGDLGESWSTLNEGLGLVQIYAGLSVHPTDPDVILAGMQDNGTNLRTADSREWTSIAGGDGGYTAIHPDDPRVVYVEFQGSGNLFRSTNGGLFFQRAATGIVTSDRTCFVPPFVLDPTDPGRLLYATHRIYESTDGGTSWRPISDDLTGGAPYAVRALAVAPANPNVVYAMTNDGRVLLSMNGGSVWDLVLEDVAGWPRVTRQIAVDPRRPSHAYVADMGFGGPRLLATLNRGRTWQEIGGGLPNVPVNSVAVYRDADNKRFLFAGTDSGVFLSRNFGAVWERYGTFPAVPVTDLVVDTFHDRLVASTLGRGAWSADLP